MRDIDNLVKKTEIISKSLKFNSSDGPQFSKIEKLDNIQSYFDQLKS